MASLFDDIPDEDGPAPAKPPAAPAKSLFDDIPDDPAPARAPAAAPGSAPARPKFQPSSEPIVDDLGPEVPRFGDGPMVTDENESPGALAKASAFFARQGGRLADGVFHLAKTPLRASVAVGEAMDSGDTSQLPGAAADTAMLLAATHPVGQAGLAALGVGLGGLETGRALAKPPAERPPGALGDGITDAVLGGLALGANPVVSRATGALGAAGADLAAGRLTRAAQAGIDRWASSAPAPAAPPPGLARPTNPRPPAPRGRATPVEPEPDIFHVQEFGPDLPPPPALARPTNPRPPAPRGRASAAPEPEIFSATEAGPDRLGTGYGGLRIDELAPTDVAPVAPQPSPGWSTGARRARPAPAATTAVPAPEPVYGGAPHGEAPATPADVREAVLEAILRDVPAEAVRDVNAARPTAVDPMLDFSIGAMHPAAPVTPPVAAPASGVVQYGVRRGDVRFGVPKSRIRNPGAR